MDIVQKEMSFESCAEDARIFVRIIEPADSRNTKAVLQIAHGMAEHSLLYMDFAKYMAGKGFAVAINDHLGHGKSVSGGGAYGYFGQEGCHGIVEDMHKLTQLMHQELPSLPYFLLGHNMGSLLARSYTAHYGYELAGAVYLGTWGGLHKAVLASKRTFADKAVKKYGAKAHYATFSKLSTGPFNQSFSPNKTNNDWLSRDEKEIERYSSDPLCGFDLTVSGYRDILYLQTEIESSKWYKTMPHIPLLFASGDKDPIGNFGKGVKKVVRRLQKQGHNPQLILYPGARHAILCETNKEEVYADILDFLESSR